MLTEPDARKGGYRVGLLGGTFDPPHAAHLIVAEWARDALALEEVWFVPAHVPPWKRARVVASPSDRLAMLRLAVAGRPYLAVQTVEYERPGPSYTANTLAALRRRYPGVSFVFLLGSDALAGLPQWYGFPGVLDLAHFAVFVRPPHTSDDVSRAIEGVAAAAGVPPSRFTLVDVPPLGISSSFVRRRLCEGRSVRSLVPDAVLAYILARALYLPPACGGFVPGEAEAPR
ncbi:MAG: nicotinate-nucleotide adenylyltransferase [Brockia lithotrophica]|nr:nicotinate-nucleotide adenylyltransferase [Brockia lithotrophica]